MPPLIYARHSASSSANSNGQPARQISGHDARHATGITFGEKINANTASILIEKTNFQYFGISQYLFKEFCRREFSDCDFVNVGDDLGFDNLRRVKMSYHPHSYGPKYTIRQKSLIK